MGGLKIVGIWKSSPFPIEIASARVKVVSDSPKKCVFGRKGGAKSQKMPALQEALQQPAQMIQTQEGTPAFSFVPAKEEFRFNFFWFSFPIDLWLF